VDKIPSAHSEVINKRSLQGGNTLITNKMDAKKVLKFPDMLQNFDEVKLNLSDNVVYR